MKITFEKDLRRIKTDSFVFLCTEDKKDYNNLISLIQKSFRIKISEIFLKDFTGKDSQVQTFYYGNKRYIFSGLGKIEKIDYDVIRKSTAKAVKAVDKFKQQNTGICIPDINKEGIDTGETAKVQAEAVVMALYSFDKYKPEDKKRKTKNFVFFGLEKSIFEKGKVSDFVKEGKVIGESVNLARDLANEPSNYAYPETVANIVEGMAKESGYNIKVYSRKEIKDMGMGGVIAVSQGSHNEPRFLEMSYNGNGKNKPMVIVGKGVTFDSGGISLKPGSGMSEMKMDMSGAAAVIGTFNAVAKLKLKINLIGLIPLVENMPGGGAIKPGDVIKAHNGKYIEIDNTDAEGRIILADALSYAKKFNPGYVIDLATLTGAAIIVLGHIASPIMGNDKSLVEKIIKASEKTSEKVWELPMWEEYEKMVESEIADVINIGPPKQAGTIMGAVFLKAFVDKYPWVHIDIAGTAIVPKAGDYFPKGGTGAGVRLLVELLKSY
jgi:leucyl aminopeptidase